MENPAPAKLDIYRTAIAMRGFEHAAATRQLAESIVVCLQLSDGRVGWGETVPRQYVTGETFESVVEDIERTIWPACVADPAAPLPVETDGRVINAAACAVELALLDATRAFDALSGREVGISARVSGLLGSSDPARTAKRLRMMRWFGLRDFKLKLGMGQDVDAENLRVVARIIGRAVAAGRCTVRVDVNGGWDRQTTPERAAELKRKGVCAIEQPIFCSAEEIVALARRCELPLMADESLLTEADADTLAAEPERVWWNVRISKNGGLRRAEKLLRQAAQAGATVSLGCMVGETGILSAAQRRLLQRGPAVRFVEGNYGRFLLSGDLTRPSPRFGYGGKLRPLRGAGMGVRVLPDRLERYAQRMGTLLAR